MKYLVSPVPRAQSPFKRHSNTFRLSRTARIVTIVFVRRAYLLTYYGSSDTCRRVGCSSSRTATFLNPAGEHRSGVRRSRQPHVCRGRVADAAGEVAARRRGADAGEQRADRQERPAADRRSRDGHVHVRRRVRSRQY